VLIAKLNPQASAYLYARFLGGSVKDSANAIAVDAAGNAYVAGSTASPDFPVTSGGNLAILPTFKSNPRSFVAKFDPNGDLVFSDLLGGASASAAQAVAVDPAGEVIVSGMASGGSAGAGFPATAGAYSVPSTVGHPYLLKLDPSGTKIVFSATGIGGSALALDSSANIYVAGTTELLDYPTTPGAYQTTFPAFYVCTFLCQITEQGPNQYVSKVDPTGSKLIYSTAVSGSGNAINAGLAVDAAGNAYLTGITVSSYPFSVTPPKVTVPSGATPNLAPQLPFLSKLDPAGANLLFSVPVGGTGVQLDSSGSVYVGGQIGPYPNSGSGQGYITANLPALSAVPQACLPNAFNITNSGYVAQVDAASGNILGSQFIGGSTLIPSAVALSGSTLWIAGATYLADFPFTPNALTVGNLPTSPTSVAGAYLGGVDFSQPAPAADSPQIGCVVDGADLAPVGPVAVNQVLTIFGTGLGPATGVNATDYSTTTLGGVSVTMGSVPAPLLYVSATQLNFAVPQVPLQQSSATLQVTASGANAPERGLPLGFNPSLFLNLPETFQATVPQPFAFALNADGSVNSSNNPAQPGSAISVFVNGLAPDPRYTSSPVQFFTVDGWSVTNISQITPSVLQVSLTVPSQLTANFACPPPSMLCTAAFTLSDLFGAGFSPGATAVSSGGISLGGEVYVQRSE